MTGPAIIGSAALIGIIVISVIKTATSSDGATGGERLAINGKKINMSMISASKLVVAQFRVHMEYMETTAVLPHHLQVVGVAKENNYLKF